MRVIKREPLEAFAARYPDSKTALNAWYKAAKHARWRNLAEVRKFYPHADMAYVESGNVVTIFNVCGNKYRLVAAIHYNRQMLFVLRIMTHQEYGRDKWKETL